jgi:hypothetical protein
MSFEDGPASRQSRQSMSLLAVTTPPWPPLTPFRYIVEPSSSTGKRNITVDDDAAEAGGSREGGWWRRQASEEQEGLQDAHHRKGQPRARPRSGSARHGRLASSAPRRGCKFQHSWDGYFEASLTTHYVPSAQLVGEEPYVVATRRLWPASTTT